MRCLYLILALLSIVAFVRGGKKTPKPPGRNVCNQKMESGNALANIRRFYFNRKQKRCLEFVYGGVGGNGNNFETLKACNDKCVCSLPPKKGNGMADDERWYFNQKENACKTFKFGGANRNANNFVSATDCLTACGDIADGNTGVEEPSPWGNNSTGGNPSTGEEDVCQLPMREGKGKATHRRWYYNGKVCMEFNFKGKRGNANNFMSEKECLNACEKDVCKQLMDKGPGRAIYYKYYYNQQEKKCIKFSYGGLGGNGNNFKSMKECRKACVNGNSNGGNPSTGEEDVCKLAMDKGPGKAKKPRYYYNKQEKKCKKFSFGGLGGNGNNFKSMKGCRKACLKGKGKKNKGKKNKGKKPSTGEENVCQLPMAVGNGRARKPRYYFNKETQRCTKFNYGGQGGNRNNFQNMEACNYECVCGLPMEKGKGKARQARWYYNREENACKKFNFGGGKRNANHFKKEKACQNACMKPQEG